MPATPSNTNESDTTEGGKTEGSTDEGNTAEAPETTAKVEESNGGCGGYVSVAGLVIVAALGAYTAFVAKKKED